MINVGSNKLLLKFISPFRVLRRRGNAYTIELPRKMRTHPTFYVGRLRPYHQFGVSSGEEFPCARTSPRDSCALGAENQHAPEARISPREDERYPDELHLARREENAVPAHSQAGRKQIENDFLAFRGDLIRLALQVRTPVPLVFEILAQIMHCALELIRYRRQTLRIRLRTCILLLHIL